VQQAAPKRQRDRWNDFSRHSATTVPTVPRHDTDGDSRQTPQRPELVQRRRSNGNVQKEQRNEARQNTQRHSTSAPTQSARDDFKPDNRSINTSSNVPRSFSWPRYGLPRAAPKPTEHNSTAPVRRNIHAGIRRIGEFRDQRAETRSSTSYPVQINKKQRHQIRCAGKVKSTKRSEPRRLHD